MRLPGGRRLPVPMAWDLGLGRELGYVFWAMIGVEAAFGAYVGIWPLWIEALGAPITVVGLVLGTSGLLRLLILAPSAALADRIDPRKMIIVGRSLTGIGMITAALATHWTMLAPMVIGSAIGEIAFPLTQAHLAAHAGEQRVRAFTLVFNVGPAIAFGIAPLISGALIARFDMRAAFIFAAVCTAFSLIFFSRFAPRPELQKEDESAHSSYREALAEPSVKPLLGMQFATIFSLALGISLLPTFLADQRGISPAMVAILGGIGSLGAVIFGLIVARSQWLQRRPLAGIVIAIAMVMSALAVVISTHLVWLIALAFIGRGGLWSAWGLYVAALSEIVRSDRIRPRVFTLSEMMGGSAFSSAPIVSGQLYAIRAEGPLLASLAASTLLIPVLLLAQLRLRASRPLTEEEEARASAAPLIDPEAA
ncbi:MAG TPA: MFS transporter [Thermomicrobiales bacterium]|nr:MFS transporter [Thermomicrobiales bacterium]